MKSGNLQHAAISKQNQSNCCALHCNTITRTTGIVCNALYSQHSTIQSNMSVHHSTMQEIIFHKGPHSSKYCSFTYNYLGHKYEYFREVLEYYSCTITKYYNATRCGAHKPWKGQSAPNCQSTTHPNSTNRVATE